MGKKSFFEKRKYLPLNLGELQSYDFNDFCNYMKSRDENNLDASVVENAEHEFQDKDWNDAFQPHEVATFEDVTTEEQKEDTTIENEDHELDNILKDSIFQDAIYVNTASLLQPLNGDGFSLAEYQENCTEPNKIMFGDSLEDLSQNYEISIIHEIIAHHRQDDYNEDITSQDNTNVIDRHEPGLKSGDDEIDFEEDLSCSYEESIFIDNEFSALDEMMETGDNQRISEGGMFSEQIGGDSINFDVEPFLIGWNTDGKECIAYHDHQTEALEVNVVYEDTSMEQQEIKLCQKKIKEIWSSNHMQKTQENSSKRAMKNKKKTEEPCKKPNKKPKKVVNIRSAKSKLSNMSKQTYPTKESKGEKTKTSKVKVLSKQPFKAESVAHLCNICNYISTRKYNVKLHRELGVVQCYNLGPIRDPVPGPCPLHFVFLSIFLNSFHINS